MSEDSNNREQGSTGQSFGMNRRDVLKSVGAAGAISAVGATAFSGSAAALTYSNPVYEPILADPSIIKTGDGTYYAYGTEDDWGNCDGTEWVPIVRSYDLANWEYIGNAFDSKPDWKDDGGLWAPDVAWYNDTWYLYYSYSVWGDDNPGIGVATSDNPEGPFYDHGKLFDSWEIGVDNSIDPNLYVHNGTPYMIWGSFNGIYGVELTGDGFDYVGGTRFHLAGNAYEAPYLKYHDGYFYLFVTTGNCCEGHSSSYEVEVGRSDSFWGPYYNQSGTDLRDIDCWHCGDAILWGNDRFAGPGHNSTIWDDSGTEWMVYHAYDTTKPEYECGDFPRRSLMIDPIDWGGGWPSINDGTPSTGSGGGGGPIPDGTYAIVNRNSGKVLDVEGGEGATEDGANVHQWEDVGGANQRWDVTHEGDGWYSLIATHSGKALDVAGGSTDAGANIHQWDHWGGGPQRFRFQHVEGDWYGIINQDSGHALDVEDFRTDNGANVLQWHDHLDVNQQWRFE